MSVQTKIPSLSPKVRITSSVRKSKSVHQEVQKLSLSGGSSLKFWKQFFSRDFRKIPYSKSDLMRGIDKKWKACCQSQNAGCYADWTYFWPDDSFFNLLKIYIPVYVSEQTFLISVKKNMQLQPHGLRCFSGHILFCFACHEWGCLPLHSHYHMHDMNHTCIILFHFFDIFFNNPQTNAVNIAWFVDKG